MWKYGNYLSGFTFDGKFDKVSFLCNFILNVKLNFQSYKNPLLHTSSTDMSLGQTNKRSLFPVTWPQKVRVGEVRIFLKSDRTIVFCVWVIDSTRSGQNVVKLEGLTWL